MCVSQNNLALTTRTICSQLHSGETQRDESKQSRRVQNKQEPEKEMKAEKRICFSLPWSLENHPLGQSMRHDEHQEHWSWLLHRWHRLPRACTPPTTSGGHPLNCNFSNSQLPGFSLNLEKGPSILPRSNEFIWELTTHKEPATNDNTQVP